MKRQMPQEFPRAVLSPADTAPVLQQLPLASHPHTEVCLSEAISGTVSVTRAGQRSTATRLQGTVTCGFQGWFLTQLPLDPYNAPAELHNTTGCQWLCCAEMAAALWSSNSKHHSQGWYHTTATGNFTAILPSP